MRRSKTYCIVMAAAMAALSIILDYLSVRTNVSKFTIYGLPLLITGILFGPWIGALAGLVVGFITQMIYYGLTITTPIWMVAPIIWGFVSGLLAKLLIKDNKLTIAKTIIIVVVTSLVATACNSVAMWLDGLIFEYPVSLTITTIGIRVAIALGLDVAYCFIIYLTYPRLARGANKKMPES